MSSASPFLHQDDARQNRYHESKSLREARELAEAKARGAMTLERLRYRDMVRRGMWPCVMQGLGNFGRKYFGFFDPKQTTGGWW